MFYCETCRADYKWTKGIRGYPTSMGNCEMCGVTSECYDVPSHALDMDVDEEEFVTKCVACEGTGRIEDPQHGHAFHCSACNGSGELSERIRAKSMPAEMADALLMDPCGVEMCQRRAMPGRKICENHAFPAARPKQSTGRRAAIAATKKKMAEETKVSGGDSDESGS